jgi:hypothetical protein
MLSGLVGQRSLAHLEKQGRSSRAASLPLEAAEASTKTPRTANRAVPQKPARQGFARVLELTAGESGSRYGKPAELEWAAVDSNHLPPRYQHGALPVELAARDDDPESDKSLVGRLILRRPRGWSVSSRSRPATGGMEREIPTSPSAGTRSPHRPSRSAPQAHTPRCRQSRSRRGAGPAR